MYFNFLEFYQKSQKLTNLEKRYCSCLMKVRNTKLNPYGICTNSVYNLQGKTRNKVVECSKYYDFSKYSVSMLKQFLKEKKIKGIAKLNKKDLVNLCKKYQDKKKIKKKSKIKSSTKKIKKKQEVIETISLNNKIFMF